MASGTANTTTVWGGIRPLMVGDSDFSPIWECELGSLGSSDAAVGTDSDDSSPLGTHNNIVTFSCSTVDTKFLAITLDQATTSAHFDHWIGDYTLLCRCKLNTAQPVRFHVQCGYSGGTTGFDGPDQFITHTAYQMIELGTISIPPLPREISLYSLQNFIIRLLAQQIGTAVTLTVDCLVLVPFTHRFKIENANIDHNFSNLFFGYTHEDGQISYLSDAAISVETQYNPTNLVYPIEGGKLVLVSQEATVQHVADLLSPVVYYYERFKTHGD
jgi:hypothetical protein